MFNLPLKPSIMNEILVIITFLVVYASPLLETKCKFRALESVGELGTWNSCDRGRCVCVCVCVCACVCGGGWRKSTGTPLSYRFLMIHVLCKWQLMT
jgi:hypothetical protein